MSASAPDLLDFERQLQALAQRPEGSLGAGLFDPARPLLLARAPGRLDVMGGFADYSGSLVLELPTREATFVAAQRTRAPRVRIVSVPLGSALPEREAVFPVQELRRACASYAEMRAYLGQDPAQSWAAYCVGALAALAIELNVGVSSGLDVLVASGVPEGKGVSSSAALEVASFRALAALGGIEVEPARVAILCQRVENLVVGAACGIMDQMASSCGSEGQLLPLTCQPARLESRFAIPSDLGVWGVDSGIRHSVAGSAYTDVRVAAFMGYTMIARSLGLPIRPEPRPGKVQVDDAVYRGYLANLSVESFELEHAQRLPQSLGGAEFLNEYFGIIDPITQVRPEQVYKVRAATAHPIYEQARTSEFREKMLRGPGHEVGPRLGELMFEAHASYGDCGLGSSGTDRLVELVRDAGHAAGLYGAKITGGGSGGTVAVLGRRDAESQVLSIARQYARESGHLPHLFSGSSPGAAEFGIASVQHDGHAWRVEPARA